MEGFDEPEAVGAVEDPVDHHRRRAETPERGVGESRGEADIDRRPPPGDAQLRHIALGDLIEWRVSRDSLIAANAWPASPTGALLGGTEGGAQQDDPNDYANVCAYPHCDCSLRSTEESSHAA